ncbi:propane monooxygenase small subunit [Propionibacteriaceae bacterium ES.041]|uniref:aromatic/alkene monooxygenase hydroxylase subunit beta n=1 Tax=Enemella evansiae TaxID=2016499 RepID=UPI000B96793A|nr:aromatic/alkene monooxygenase hydroxylase subunit beta [Enemella evansiae]OYN98599.1 toluene hydroxylase [Enemella evansiae]PFG65705.1 propane monooxygenase small subunit [Propionibacteriaceae bacterium ES.041]
MSEQTAIKERSFPSIEFTDAEAGALEFPSSSSRHYNYFKPAKRRATMYEDVTVDVQPDPERYLTQGWIYGFAEGEGGYPKDWTLLRSSDWHVFRDPNEEWNQTIYRRGAEVVAQVQLTLTNATNANAYAAWDAAWTRFVERNLGAWMHVEHGLGLHVFTPMNRRGPTNMINTTACVAAGHKLRVAQDLALFNLDLGESVEGFDGSAHKEVWQNAPEWQAVRENLERITAVDDWAEMLFATNVVFEQLVGALFRSELVMQVAARNSDYVTPTLIGTAENDYNAHLRGSRNLFKLLTGDEQHGAENKAKLQQWLETWLPRSLEAANQLQPIWSQPHEKPVTFADSLAKAKQSMATLLTEIGLDVPKEIQQ